MAINIDLATFEGIGSELFTSEFASNMTDIELEKYSRDPHFYVAERIVEAVVDAEGGFGDDFDVEVARKTREILNAGEDKELLTEGKNRNEGKELLMEIKNRNEDKDLLMEVKNIVVEMNFHLVMEGR